jgi:hypothetical protein
MQSIKRGSFLPLFCFSLILGGVNMARFLVQHTKNELELEEQIILSKLKSAKYNHEFEQLTLEEIKTFNDEGFVPVGTIEFISTYLKNVYGIERENPIEIPKYLRTDEFLKRDYYFTTWDKLPREGVYFLKDASILKKYSGVIRSEYFIDDTLFEEPAEHDVSLRLSKDSIYLVSSVFDIKSEYRVYVISGEIENVSYYNGDATLFPDMTLVKKAVSLINMNEKWLKSYTLDIMVGDKGTAIIEVHNFTSVGLYSNIWGNSLLYAYKDGIDYLINDNHKLEI